MKSKKLRYFFVVAGLLVLGLLLVRSAFRVSQAQAQSGSQLPAFGHVVFVPLEDHSYSQTVATLSDHVTLASGQILTNNDNYTPGSSMSCSDSSTVACSNSGLGYQTVDNIAKEMEAAYGTGSWKGYVECIPYAGYTTSTAIQTCPSGVPNSTDHYYMYHGILAYFTNVTQTNRVPFYDPSTGAGFAHDVSAGALPPFSFIGPDGCDDAHDCSLSTADTWLQNKVVTPLQQSRYFQSNGDGLLIITFDEDNNPNNDGCALQTGTDCGGQIATVIVSPYIIRQNYLQTSGDPTTPTAATNLRMCSGLWRRAWA